MTQPPKLSSTASKLGGEKSTATTCSDRRQGQSKGTTSPQRERERVITFTYIWRGQRTQCGKGDMAARSGGRLSRSMVVGRGLWSQGHHHGRNVRCSRYCPRCSEERLKNPHKPKTTAHFPLLPIVYNSNEIHFFHLSPVQSDQIIFPLPSKSQWSLFPFPPSP